MSKIQKIGQNRTHESGVTMVKESPVNSAYNLLVPGKAPVRFGSYASGMKAMHKAIAELTA